MIEFIGVLRQIATIIYYPSIVKEIGLILSLVPHFIIEANKCQHQRVITSLFKRLDELVDCSPHFIIGFANVLLF